MPPLRLELNDILPEMGRRAATLHERLDRPESGLGTPMDDEPIWVKEALSAWERAFAQGDARALTRRLSWDSLDRDEVVTRLVAHARRTDRPSWTDWVERAVAEGERMAHAGEDEALLSSTPRSPFEEVWRPFVICARQELERRAGRAMDRLESAPRRALEEALVHDLASHAELALLERYRAARRDDDSAGAYGRFVRGLVGEPLVALLADLPVLARYVCTLVETWVTAQAEMLQRLAHDAAAIHERFEADPDRIVHVAPQRSDRHHGGRSVTLLRFASGLGLAYKPRGVRAERAYQDFVALLAEQGLEDLPASMRVLERDGYGWAELVPQDGFSSREQVERAFRGAGAVVCLAYALRGRDLHQENVVATRGGPVLVDTEALLAPVELGDGDGDHEEHGASPDDSCLATGLLSLVQVDPNGETHDLGGLRPAEPRATSLPWRRWHDLGSDDIGFVEERMTTPALANDVVLEGNVQLPEGYASEVATGFERAYRFLLARRDALLATGGALERFADVRTRVLFRPSDQYAALLRLLATPRYQRDGMDLGLAMETLLRPFAREEQRPRLWPLVADERHALENLDVPRFTVVAADGRLLTESGEEVRDQYAASGIEAVRRRLEGFTERDLERQLALIAAALAPTYDQHHGSAPDSEAGAGPERLVHAAEVIAQALLDHAHETDDGLRWPALGERLDLYGGQAGPALLFAALARATENVAWGHACEKALRRLTQVGPAPEAGSPRRLGIGSGLGSMVYALTLAAELTARREWIDAAARWALEITPERIAAEEVMDVVDGVAGALLALLALHRLRADDSLALRARACGERLCATQVPTSGDGAAWHGHDGLARSGLAHGAAGIALALSRLFAVSPDERWREAARRAFMHERSLYSVRDANWSYVRVAGGTAPMIAWCHGAAGIGLARALSGAVADAEVEEEIRHAMETTRRAPRARFDHVCCGGLARAEALLTVGRRVGVDEWTATARALASEVAERTLASGWRGARSAGFAHRVFRPGFFQGLAGIGYALVRAALPDRVPSVLGFELVSRLEES